MKWKHISITYSMLLISLFIEYFIHRLVVDEKYAKRPWNEFKGNNKIYRMFYEVEIIVILLVNME